MCYEVLTEVNYKVYTFLGKAHVLLALYECTASIFAADSCSMKMEGACSSEIFV
jgi:hypothetical protein